MLSLRRAPVFRGTDTQALDQSWPLYWDGDAHLQGRLVKLNAVGTSKRRHTIGLIPISQTLI